LAWDEAQLADSIRPAELPARRDFAEYDIFTGANALARLTGGIGAGVHVESCVPTTMSSWDTALEVGWACLRCRLVAAWMFQLRVSEC